MKKVKTSIAKNYNLVYNDINYLLRRVDHGL